MEGYQTYVTERRRLRALEQIFCDAGEHENQGLAIRVTARGLWVPTPFAVLAVAVQAMHAGGFFDTRARGRNTVLDAGTGAGRLLAAVAHFDSELDVIGIEADARLFHRAVANVAALASLVTRAERVRVARGDYCSAGTYASSDVELDDIGWVFNYPDGNQHLLERFVRDALAPGTKLCLLTHDPDVHLSHLELVSKTHDRDTGWHWSVYSR